jgi:endonuclease/exonuclease/phosphatase family metal-dependent hydrolase
MVQPEDHNKSQRGNMYHIEKIGITCAIILVVLAHHSVLQEDRGSADLREPHSPTDRHISVLSWNVNRGMPRARKTVQAIKKINADMVFLQETHERWEEGLRPALSPQYEYVKFLHGRGAGGQAIFSRYPFREVDRVNTRRGWFPTWINKFQTPIGMIQVASVHLRPPLDEEGGVTASSLSEAPDIRQEEVRALAGRIGQAPTLVVGDFNEEIDGERRVLASQGAQPDQCRIRI